MNLGKDTSFTESSVVGFEQELCSALEPPQWLHRE